MFGTALLLRAARRAWLVAALGVATTFLTPAAALAKTEVVLTSVEVPAGKEAVATEKMVRRLVAASAKRAQWGKATHKVRIETRVTELELVEGDGVLRVRCTMSGRLEGGPGARSRLVYGGKPSQRKELTRKVLAMVADGLVTRLAQLARDRTEPHRDE